MLAFENKAKILLNTIADLTLHGSRHLPWYSILLVLKSVFVTFFTIFIGTGVTLSKMDVAYSIFLCSFRGVLHKLPISL